MPTVTTETANGPAVRKITGADRGRKGSPGVPLDTKNAPSPRRNGEVPRSASYTYLPVGKERSFSDPSAVLIKGNFTEADLVPSAPDVADISPPDSSGYTTPDDVEIRTPTDQTRDFVAALHMSPKLATQGTRPVDRDDSSSVTSGAFGSRQSLDSIRSISTVGTVTTVGTASCSPSGTSTPRPRAPTKNSFTKNFSRTSAKFYGPSPATSEQSSRSASPVKNGVISTIEENEGGVQPVSLAKTARRKSFLRRRDSGKPTRHKSSEDGIPTVPEVRPEDVPIRPRTASTRKKSARPISGIFKVSTNDEPPPLPPAVPAFLKSFSTDRLPMMRSSSRDPVDRAAPAPRLLTPSERTTSSGISITRKKDELWNVFRTLDGDYAKFTSKSTAFKANVVRTSLLPFLRTYATHASNRILRPEDLDRRANILNKWWTGMIEMLHGRNNQSISGTDRPAILDGISGIMERPEWRLPPSPFSPLVQRIKGTATPQSRSTTSLGSSASEFLTESVHHNVRNIFIQNLSAQMAFVVDKMSLRNASASLVTFCGKACAYAFMFVPGMADILVRLWELPIDTIRRVLQENGVGKFDKLADMSSHVASSFPPALQPLAFVSLMSYMKKLRTPPPLPLGTTNIQWWGYWLERWTGRESDLFYVFVKHFHILTQDFLPLDSGPLERMCAPGLILVHSQVLSNLDATIHRDKSQGGSDPSLDGVTQTFDDMLQGDPDAVATALPLPPTNAIRMMAENRLIMLIRDFLSDRLADHPTVRRLFAESFNSLLQAAARGISMFDHAACYTLLDFLEEALPMIVRFEHMTEGENTTLINPDFWKKVCRMMIDSHNTMTEIRLYAFLYTVWNTVICDADRKTDLCLGLLLEPEIFESRFNHWCPMVRAYYMRLLCWRVGRHDGEATEADMQIMETLLERLQLSWSYYLHLRDRAAQTHGLLPPTHPCNPAPSRRLLIIRTDNQPVIPGQSFFSFDGVIQSSTPSPPAAQQPTPNKRFSVLSTVTTLDERPSTSHSTSDSELEPRKGLRGFLKNMLGSKARSRSQGPARGPLQRAATPHSDLRPFSPLARSATDGPPHASSSKTNLAADTATAAKPQPKPVQMRNFSFKFSLEYQPNAKAHPPMRLLAPRLPLPAQRYLQDNSPALASLLKMRDQPVEPRGESVARARYCGRALAEWMQVVGECQSFFDRRKHEGVPTNKFVETPALGVEVFRRPS